MQKEKKRLPEPKHLIQWDEHLTDEDMEKIRNEDEEPQSGRAGPDDDFWLPDIEERS